MPKEISDIIGLIANISAILTAIIAIVFFFNTLKRNYYLNDIPGNYKIFSGLRENENASVLNQIKITYVSQKGWFFGYLKCSEIFKDQYSGSSGEASVFGKIKYSYWRIVVGKVYRLFLFKNFNPLEAKNFSSFHGTIYLLSRNDLDIAKDDWKRMIIQEYSIIHYKDSNRFKLYDPKISETYLQLPNEFVLINTDKISDQMYNHEVN